MSLVSVFRFGLAGAGLATNLTLSAQRNVTVYLCHKKQDIFDGLNLY